MMDVMYYYSKMGVLLCHIYNSIDLLIFYAVRYILYIKHVIFAVVLFFALLAV